jgi:hypothetical protein
MNFVMLALLAGLGLSGLSAAQAEAKNLSCISGISPSEQRLLRDCEPKPKEEEEIIYVLEVIDPPQPPEPARMKHGEGGKGNGAHGRDKDRDSSAGGGNSGGPHGAAN